MDDLLAPPTTLELTSTPNPFQRSTRIDYALAIEGAVTLTVHDLRGGSIATLANGAAPAGRYSVVWDGSAAGGGRAPAGVYFVRLAVSAGGRNETKLRKIVLMN